MSKEVEQKEKPGLPVPNKDESNSQKLLKWFAVLIKEVGPGNFFMAFSVVLLLFFATDEQRSYFIDKFILLKHIGDNPIPYTLVVVVLVFIIFVKFYWDKREIDLRKEENEYLRNRIKELESKK